MKKRVLVIAPRKPYPPVGGDRLRILSLCRMLAAKYSVTLVTLCEDKAELASSYETDLFASEHRVFHPKWKSLITTAFSVFSKQPLQNAYFFNAKFAKTIQELAPTHDLVVAHLVRGAQYMTEIYETPTLLEMTDAISLNYDRVRRSTGRKSLRSLIYSFEQNRVLNFEKYAVERFSYTSLISQVDKDWITGHGAPSEKVGVHTLAIDTGDIRFTPNRRGKDIAFIGNISTVQNADACFEFIHRVLPLIRQERELRFLIVGKCSQKLRQTFNSFEGVYATGRVESVEDYIADAFCGVCFLRLGAGIQTKILEYMAFGLPSVVTSFAYEGLSARKGHDLIVVDDERAFANAVLALYDSPKSAVDFAERGRQYVEKTHDIDVVANGFMSAVDQVLRSA